MKSYEETIQTVFDRIHTNRKKQAQCRLILSTALPLLCLGALLLGLQQSPIHWEEPSVLSSAGEAAASLQPEENSSRPEDSITVHSMESLPAAQDNDQIVVHAIDGIAEDRMMICLHTDDFVELNRVELTEYYGTEVFPAVPSDLTEWEDQRYGVYRRESGTGDVYWDGNVLNYSSEDFSRSVNVEVMKGHIPTLCFCFFDSVEEKSVIGGVEVALGLSSNGYYYAEFMHNDVGFFVITEGFTQEETVAVLASLLE